MLMICNWKISHFDMNLVSAQQWKIHFKQFSSTLESWAEFLTWCICCECIHTMTAASADVWSNAFLRQVDADSTNTTSKVQRTWSCVLSIAALAVDLRNRQVLFFLLLCPCHCTDWIVAACSNQSCKSSILLEETNKRIQLCRPSKVWSVSCSGAFANSLQQSSAAADCWLMSKTVRACIAWKTIRSWQSISAKQPSNLLWASVH